MSKPAKSIGSRIKAIAHPTRRRILFHLQTTGLASPNQMSVALEEALGNISYHTKVLREYDCIELAKIKPRRGAVEHYYRIKPDAAIGSRQWQEVPSALQGEVTAAALDDLVTCFVKAFEHGTFQARDGSRISTLSLVLDEAGWMELLKVLREVGDSVGKIAMKSAARMKDPAEGIPFLLALAAFEAGGSQNGLQGDSTGSTN